MFDSTAKHCKTSLDMSSEALTPAPITEVATPDGESYLRVVEETTDDQGIDTIVIDQQIDIAEIDQQKYPDAEQTPFNYFPHVYDASTPDRVYGDNEATAFVFRFGEFGAWSWMRETGEDDVLLEPDLLHKLGYNLEIEEGRDGTIAARRIHYSMPSLSRWQEIVELAHPNGGEPLQFDQYPGGLFSNFEGASSMINDGKVLVASDVAYRIHDLSDHPIGYFMFGDTLMAALRKRLELLFTREAIEAALPPLMPSDTEGAWVSGNAEKFAHPARTLIAEYNTALDGLSTRFARLALFEDRRAMNRFETTLSRQADSIRSSFYGATTEPPRAFMQPFDDEVVFEAAREAMARFKTLKHVSDQLHPAA